MGRWQHTAYLTHPNTGSLGISSQSWAQLELGSSRPERKNELRARIRPEPVLTITTALWSLGPLCTWVSWAGSPQGPFWLGGRKA